MRAKKLPAAMREKVGVLKRPECHNPVNARSFLLPPAPALASSHIQVKDYFYLQFSDGKLHKEEEIFDFLSPVLKREIKQFTARDICRRVPLLSTPKHRDFAQDISCFIEPTLVFANEVVMREQTTGDEMFFICSGVVEIYVSSMKCSSYLAIGDGCVSSDSDIPSRFFCASCSPSTVFRRSVCAVRSATDGLGKIQNTMHALSHAKEQLAPSPAGLSRH